MGKNKALIALANTLLKLCYVLLKTKQVYKEQVNEQVVRKEYQKEQRVIKQLQIKGYIVEKA